MAAKSNDEVTNFGREPSSFRNYETRCPVVNGVRNCFATPTMGDLVETESAAAMVAEVAIVIEAIAGIEVEIVATGEIAGITEVAEAAIGEIVATAAGMEEGIASCS